MSQALQNAIRDHQAGRLDQAEGAYQQILAREPEHAAALHLLGVLRHQRGRHDEAAELIARAAALNPGQAAYHSNLAEVYRALGSLPRAERECREALRFAPGHAEAHNNLGLVLRQAGRHEEAVPAFEAAIDRRPTWAQPFLSLGVLLRDLARPYEAAAVFREGLRLCGEAPLLRHTLSELLVELGLPGEALAHSQEAVRLRPDQAAAHLGLGDALAALGRGEEARASYQKAMALDPALAAPYTRLGQLAQTEGRPADALTWFAEAARRAPGDPAAGCHHAGALAELGRDDEAVAELRAVIARAPDYGPAHNALGYMLQDRGDLAAAEAAYREAIRLRPDHPDARVNLGLLLLESGDGDPARAELREAQRLAPDHPEALSALAMSLRDRLPPEETAACERALAGGRFDGRRRAVLQYGFAQTMDGRGLYDRAAALAAEANAYFLEDARRRGRGYDPAGHRDYVDRLIAAFPADHFDRARGWGSDTEVPVFVIGLPRSGTSLVEQILASHPAVFGAGELNLVRDLYRALPGVVGRTAPGVDCVDALTADHCAALAADYLDRVPRPAPFARRVVDKMPDNYLMLGLIATLFPRARVIHTRRDVRDTGLSCWLTHFRHINWACDLGHIGERVREYRLLMAHWDRVLPGRVLEIEYEHLVADLDAGARRLTAWCGLEWDPACLSFHATKRVVRTASMAQVREPVYQRSVGRWRHYREHLGPLLAVLGEPPG